jgi:hypothetical protein
MAVRGSSADAGDHTADVKRDSRYRVVDGRAGGEGYADARRGDVDDTGDRPAVTVIEVVDKLIENAVNNLKRSGVLRFNEVPLRVIVLTLTDMASARASTGETPARLACRRTGSTRTRIRVPFGRGEDGSLGPGPSPVVAEVDAFLL